jgi:hypothetical protein
MKIITKKQEQEAQELIERKMRFLAGEVYQRTLRWAGNNDDAIPDRGRELRAMVEAVLIVDDVISHYV